MSVWDISFTGDVTFDDIREKPTDTIVVINISEEARALVEHSKDPESIQANIYNLTDDIGKEIEDEAMNLLEEE